MSMKKIFLLAILLFTSVFVLAGNFKLGYVDTDRIYREASSTQAIQQKLVKEFAARRDVLKKMADRGKELQSILSRNNLSQEDRKRYAREYVTLDRDWRTRSTELAEDFNQRRNEEFASIQEMANKLIKQIAKREQYDLILQDAVYVDPAHDLTNELLKKLNKQTNQK